MASIRFRCATITLALLFVAVSGHGQTIDSDWAVLQPNGPVSSGAESTSQVIIPPSSVQNPSSENSRTDSISAVETFVAANDPFTERNFKADVLVMPVDRLLGDWLGVLPRLEDDGITPSVTFVSDMLGNPVGGVSQGFTEANNLGVNIVFDLEKRYGLEGGSFLSSMSQKSGKSLSEEYIGNAFGAQQVFGPPTFHVVHLAYRQKLLEDKLELRLGRIATADDFLVSPYNYGYVQGGIDGSPAGIFINSPGISGYPNATWGALAKFQSTARTYLMGGLYNGDTTIRDLDNRGLDMSLEGPLFAIVEAAYQRNQLAGDNGLIGNYKVGAWFDGNNFPDLETQALATEIPGLGLVPEVKEGNYGFYGVFDQVFVRFSSPRDEILRGIGMVTSVVIAPDESFSRMPYFFNVGLAARGIFPRRPRDATGFAVIYGEFSSDTRSGQRQAQLIDPTVQVQHQEVALEWTYIFRFRNGAYFVQPDLQYIIQPNGIDQIADALVLGLQVGFNF